MNTQKYLEQVMLLVVATVIIYSINYRAIQPQRQQVEATPFMKHVKFHVIVMNGLSRDILDVNCSGDGEIFRLQHLAVNTNFTFSLYTAFLYTVHYYCDIRWSQGHIHFVSFRDNGKFIDNECGGRHCIWKATDLGLYLYQIHDQKFVFKFGWGDNN